jgi:cytochrome c
LTVAATRWALALLALAAGGAIAQPSQQVLRQGEQVYARCQACHSLDVDRTGPHHCGLFGRRAGSVPGFDYSEAMKRSGITWNAQTLDRFLANPAAMVPGTEMTYAGVRDSGERAALIAWLQQATRCRPKG